MGSSLVDGAPFVQSSCGLSGERLAVVGWCDEARPPGLGVEVDEIVWRDF